MDAAKFIEWWDSLPRGHHSIREVEAWIERARSLVTSARQEVEKPYTRTNAIAGESGLRGLR